MLKLSRTWIVLGSAGLVGLVAVSGLAYADREHGGRGHGPMMMQNFAERYDANQDGKISQEEIDTNRTTTYGAYDENKDNGLTLTEFEKLWLKANNERMVREFQDFDADGDAKVTLDEYKSPMENMVSRMDSNGDGALSKDDRPAHRGKHRGQDGDHNRGDENPG